MVSMAFPTTSIPVKATSTIYGPRVDQLLVRLYNSNSSEFVAMENGEIDLIDAFLDANTTDRWKMPPYNSTIALDSVINYTPSGPVNRGYLAHNRDWHQLNVETFGVRDWWNIYCTSKPSVGVTGGQLRLGFNSDVQMLNPIYSESQSDWQILNELFDTLIRFNPLNPTIDMPWMATNWTSGTWLNPDTGKIASVYTYALRSGIKWVNVTNGAELGDVTPDDVRFSYQYVYDHAGHNYPIVSDMFSYPNGTLKVAINSNVISFYMSHYTNLEEFRVIGNMPIIPKFIYENIADPHGFYAGNEGIKTLIGSGPFYFVNYTNAVNCTVTANRKYFATIVPDRDISPASIKTTWGIFRSNTDYRWAVTWNDVHFVEENLGWTGPPGAIPWDVNRDGKLSTIDLVIISSNIGADWISDTFLSDIEVNNLQSCKDSGSPKPVVCQGYSIHLSVHVANKGTFVEYFYVRFYLNSTQIGYDSVVLTPYSDFFYKQSETVSIHCTIPALPSGNYTLRVVADTVPDERYVDNNIADGVAIRVSKAGDTNCDGVVNVLDLIVIANALTVYNSIADLNDDHAVNVLDLIIVATHLDK
jgi:ABC-type transport system substrate-binding protein